MDDNFTDDYQGQLSPQAGIPQVGLGSAGHVQGVQVGGDLGLGGLGDWQMIGEAGKHPGHQEELLLNPGDVIYPLDYSDTNHMYPQPQPQPIYNDIQEMPIPIVGAGEIPQEILYQPEYQDYQPEYHPDYPIEPQYQLPVKGFDQVKE